MGLPRSVSLFRFRKKASPNHSRSLHIAHHLHRLPQPGASCDCQDRSAESMRFRPCQVQREPSVECVHVDHGGGRLLPNAVASSQVFLVVLGFFVCLFFFCLVSHKAFASFTSFVSSLTGAQRTTAKNCLVLQTLCQDAAVCWHAEHTRLRNKVWQEHLNPADSERCRGALRKPVCSFKSLFCDRCGCDVRPGLLSPVFHHRCKPVAYG